MDGNALLGGETAQLLITALLAVFGGIARILSQKEKTPVKVNNVLSGCIIASFTGVLAYFATGYFKLPQNAAYIIAAVSGWLGPQVLDIFTNIVLEKAGINLRMGPDSKLTPGNPDTELIDKLPGI